MAAMEITYDGTLFYQIKHTINFLATLLYTAVLLDDGCDVTKLLATDGTDGI